MTDLWFKQALLPEGWAASVRLQIADGRLEAVEAGVPPRDEDERHGIGLPGLPNLHSHVFQRAMAGRAERRTDSADDFWLWRTRMYELAAAVEPQDLSAIAALAYAEMLQSGFVRVGEFHYLHNARDGRQYDDPAEMAASVAAAAAETGIDLTLLPVFYAHAGFGGRAPLAEQARFLNDIDSYATLLEASRKVVAGLPDAVVGVAPHSLRAVTEAELLTVSALAPAQPVHIHVAEQVREVEDSLAHTGQRPVAWLLSNAAVDSRWCLVHATHLDRGELAGLARSGAVAGLCPITEANLGDGLFAAGEFLAAGGRYGIGSDSNVRIDAAEELRWLEYGQRLTHRARNVLADANRPTADRLYADVLSGGAQALGCARPGLRAGTTATLVSLDPRHPALAEASEPELLSRWIFASGSGAVDCVWTHGRRVVAGGVHVRWARIVEDYRRAVRRIRDVLET